MAAASKSTQTTTHLSQQGRHEILVAARYTTTDDHQSVDEGDSRSNAVASHLSHLCKGMASSLSIA